MAGADQNLPRTDRSLARRAKICHLIHDDGPGGGPVTVTNHLTYYADYFDVAVIHGGYGRIARVCAELGIPHYQLPLERLSMLPLALFPLVNRLRAINPDVLLLHGQWGAFIGAIAAKLAGIERFIYVAQWPAFYTDWDLWRVVRNRVLEAVPCRFAQRVVAVSRRNYYEFLLRKLVRSDRLVCIPNPVEIDRLPDPSTAQERRASLGFTSEYCNVLSIGRLADQKRVDWLLYSWARVAARGAKAHLWVVGDGPERERLLALTRELQIGHSCTFLGERLNGIEYIAAADIVAMTTMYESFGLVALEAMACGVPVVANQVAGVEDTVRNDIDGYLVPPGDIDAFADALLTLIEHPERRNEMGENGRVRAREFSKRVVMPHYLSLIQTILSHD